MPPGRCARRRPASSQPAPSAALPVARPGCLSRHARRSKGPLPSPPRGSRRPRFCAARFVATLCRCRLGFPASRKGFPITVSVRTGCSRKGAVGVRQATATVQRPRDHLKSLRKCRTHRVHIEYKLSHYTHADAEILTLSRNKVKGFLARTVRRRCDAKAGGRRGHEDLSVRRWRYR